MSRIQIVSSLRSSDDLFFTVTFSSGEKLNFTAEEAFEYGLYLEGEFIENFENVCTVVLAKRMMAFAASYVLFSMKSISQVKTKLEEYCKKAELEDDWLQFSESAVEEALRRLRESEYINDETYSRRYTNTTLKSKPVSKAALLNELVYKKGIDKDLAHSKPVDDAAEEKTVEEIYANDHNISDGENAYRLLKKKTGGNIPYGDDSVAKKELAKLYRFAGAKGFSYRDIEEALSRIREENN